MRILPWRASSAHLPGEPEHALKLAAGFGVLCHDCHVLVLMLVSAESLLWEEVPDAVCAGGLARGQVDSRGLSWDD